MLDKVNNCMDDGDTPYASIVCSGYRSIAQTLTGSDSHLLVFRVDDLFSVG